jgi:hypothetical protein
LSLRKRFSSRCQLAQAAAQVAVDPSTTYKTRPRIVDPDQATRRVIRNDRSAARRKIELKT